MAGFLAGFRSWFILTGFVIYTVLGMPLQWLLVITKHPWRFSLPMIFHKGLCRFLGLRVHVHGDIFKRRPVLIVANHTSYYDITVLSSVTELSFVAKSEVASWPGVGLMARLQNTVFVSRERRTKAGEDRNTIHGRLALGHTVVLFPEGTSHDGNTVLPFKSALLGAAEWPREERDRREPILVQPVSVIYSHLHGLPMGRQFRPFFAWYGDMPFISHLMNSFRLGPIDVEVLFHPAVTVNQLGSRKALAEYCQKVVSSGVGHGLKGIGGLPESLPVPAAAQ